MALGFRGQLATGRDGDPAGRLDLKRGAIIPLVNLVRFHALATGVTISPTLDRIEAVASVGGLDRAIADALARRSRSSAGIRFEHHAELIAAGRAARQPDRPRTSCRRSRAPSCARRSRVVRRSAAVSSARGRHAAALRPRKEVAPATTFAGESVRVGRHWSRSCPRSTLIRDVWDSRSVHEVRHAARAARGAPRARCSSSSRTAVRTAPASRSTAIRPRPGGARCRCTRPTPTRSGTSSAPSSSRRVRRVPRGRSVRATHAVFVIAAEAEDAEAWLLREPSGADADERRPLDRDLQGGGPADATSSRGSRSHEHRRHPRARPHADGDREPRHDRALASVLDRARSVPRPQRLALEPQPPAPDARSARGSGSRPTTTARSRPAT